MTEPQKSETVSRKRFEREKKAREEAERLLEDKSRLLFLANEKLSSHATELEAQVAERTSELSSALQRAEAAILARARFIATMSHEIRTPLGGLLGIVDILATDESDAEKLQLLEYAKASGESLRTIVNDVLDFSRIDAGSMHMEREPVDMRSIIFGLVELAKSQLEDDAARLSMTIDPEIPERFWGDATRIRQVISNLLTNAIRYSETGPISVRASVMDQTGTRMTIKVGVKDAGVGIPDEDQSKLFKDFSQVQNPLTKAAQGTGLGLALCRRIIDKIGGKIDFQSIEGIGSNFWFEIPVDIVVAQDKAAAAGSKTPEISLEGARILLAEDNKINQKVLSNYLTRMGCQVLVVGNGQEALDAFEVGKFDVILMDLAMPVMDGFTAIKALRRVWKAKDLPPMAFLTAHLVQHLPEVGRDVAVDAHLAKPISYNELRAALSDLIANARPKAATDSPPYEAEYSDGTNPEFEDARSVIKLMSPEVAAGIIVGLDQATLINLVQDLVDSVRASFATMRDHHAKAETKELSEIAHSLKGASALLGFRPVSQLFAVVEQEAAELTRPDLEDALTGLDEEVRKIEKALGMADPLG